MQALQSRKSSRDFGSADSPLPCKRLKTEESVDMENGDTYMNGNGNVVDAHVNHPEFLGSRGLVNREEYIRLLAQALYGLGFRSAAKDLEAASGIDCEPAEVRAFRHAVTEGSWDRAVKLLSDLTFSGDTAHKKAKFMVLTEKYLEVHKITLFLGFLVQHSCTEYSENSQKRLAHIRLLSGCRHLPKATQTRQSSACAWSLLHCRWIQYSCIS